MSNKSILPQTFIKQVIYYFQIYKSYAGWKLFGVFTFSILSAIGESFGIAMILPVLSIIDNKFSKGFDNGFSTIISKIVEKLGIHDSIPGILLFVSLIFIVKGILKFIGLVFQSNLRENIQRIIKSKILGLYENMKFEYYIQRNTGHFTNILNSQVNQMITSFDSYKDFLISIMTTIVYLSIAYLMAPDFALMTILAGIFFLYLMKNLNSYSRKLSQNSVTEAGKLSKFTVQLLQSFKYLSATGQFTYLKDQALSSIFKQSELQRKTQIASGFSSAMQEPLSVLLVLSLVAIQVGYLGKPLAPIAVSLILIHRSMAQIINIQNDWQKTMSKIGSFESVDEELNLLNSYQSAKGVLIIPPLNQGISMINVNFGYTKDVLVLKNINIQIEANKTIAIVGSSGSGKSTLIDLLTLLLEQESGSIEIDGTNSKEILKNNWRNQIGYVSQDLVVFDDTVGNNISLWKEDYNLNATAREKIERSAKQAYADSFISELPHGYNTIVGDRGIRLSGGQKQRLFIARELYKNPKLLILDEATSALDSESEKFIQNSIDNLKGKMTVVIIAHRLSTIKNADKIYVLDKGEIIEEGSYKDLISNSLSKFNSMVEFQKL